MARRDADRDLLFGVLARRLDFVTRDALNAAMTEGRLDPDRTLGEILRDQDALDDDERELLDALVARHLHRHGGDSGASLAALQNAPGAREVLAEIADLDPQGTLPHIPLGDSIASNSTGLSGEAAGGRFRKLRAHARGNLGIVSLAYDRELHREVALKEIRRDAADDPASRERFLLEAEVTGRLEHPGIVPVYSLGRDADGRPYYAMRFVEGETLREAIERFHAGSRTSRGDDARDPAFRRLLRGLVDTCNAVAFAHSRGVVHRDLKPENIMLGPFGETLVVDWGLAKTSGARDEAAPVPAASEEASMTRPGSILGTPRYMSPEQAAGHAERIGPASDIYSLGAILYGILAGRSPFTDVDVATVLDRVRRGIFPAPRRVRRSVDPTLEAICMKAMALAPADRHASALELAAELEAWQADVRYRGEQERALGHAKESLARLYLERASQSFARGSDAEGMLWLARGVEEAPAEPGDLARVARTNVVAWHLGGKLMERALRHGGEVHAVAFCSDGRRLAAACGDGSARLWDISGGAPLAPPRRHDGPVRVVAFLPGGGGLATAGDDGLIRRWDAVTGEPIGEPIPCGGPVVALLVSPDGSRLAACGRAGLALWDADQVRPLHGIETPRLPACALAFSPDGVTVAVACDDEGIHLLAASDGRSLAEPMAHGEAIVELAFAPDGRRLLAGCRDGSARLWDLHARTVSASSSQPSEVTSIAFRADGDAFATAGADGAARLWETATGLPIGEPLVHRGRLDRLTFQPDGSMLATGGGDGLIRLWCAVTGLPIGPPLAHGEPVRALVFSRDGRRLASGGGAMARCWKVPFSVEGDPERLRCWVGVSTGLEFDAGDAIRPMAGERAWDLRRRLDILGGPPLR